MENVMQPAATPVPASRKLAGAGWTLTGLAALFLLMDGTMKLFSPPPVVEAFTRLGLPLGTALALGALQLACTLLYLVPRTSVLGAVLLTGFLGGAVSIHVRVADPLLSHVLFPVYVGLMVWGGLYFRDARLRALLPLRA